MLTSLETKKSKVKVPVSGKDFLLCYPVVEGRGYILTYEKRKCLKPILSLETPSLDNYWTQPLPLYADQVLPLSTISLGTEFLTHRTGAWIQITTITLCQLSLGKILKQYFIFSHEFSLLNNSDMDYSNVSCIYTV